MHGLPVVLIGTPFDSWQAAMWTPSFLAEKVKFILSKKGQENVFKYFAVDQPLSTLEAFTVSKPFQEVMYPGRRFFELLEEPFDGSYYYSSGGVEQLDLEDSYRDNSLSKLTFTASGNLGQVNFWFGGANVTAFTHYDTSHNLHAVVYGKKKFIIFPPSAYAELGLYPSLHQFYRQVHLDVLSPEMPLYLKSKSLEVALNPGEVLYLPPYWFHCVISLETTISVNVWSNSDPFLQMEEIFAASIPFEEHWGTVTLLQSFNYFVKLLVSNIVSGEGFVRNVLFRRYEKILTRVTELKQQELSASARQYCLLSSLSGTLDTGSIEHIQQGVLRTAKMFMKMSPEAVREINLGNYIEHVAWRVLGSDNIVLLPFYLKECF